MFLSFNSSMSGDTSVAGTTYASGTPEFTPVFCGVHFTRSLVFCGMFCISLYFLSFFDMQLQHFINNVSFKDTSFSNLN